MAGTLRYVDPSCRPGRFARLYASLATSRVSRFISRHIGWKLDPLLLRVTRGRLATTLIFPTAVLETQGAKSGIPRRNAVIYFNDGDRVTIAASNAGGPRDPAWYYNLRANPSVTFGRVPMDATVMTDQAETERLWRLADNVFPAYAAYRLEAAKVGRTIPIIQLVAR